MDRMWLALVRLVSVFGPLTRARRPSTRSALPRQSPATESSYDVARPAIAAEATAVSARNATAPATPRVPESADPVRRFCPTSSLRSYPLRKSELLPQQFHSAVKVYAHRRGRQSGASSDFRTGHSFDEPQHQRLAISVGQTPNQVENLVCSRVGRVAAPHVVSDLDRFTLTSIKVDGAVAGNHCDPWSKRRFVAQRIKLPVRVQEDVLNEIIDFAAWNASEQDAVDEWRVKSVKLSESVAVAFECSADQHGFDSRLIQLLGCGVCLRSHQKHVRCGIKVVHRAASVRF